MIEKRYAIIHFIDGTQMTLDFPKQTADSNVATKLQKLQEQPWLMIEADGNHVSLHHIADRRQ